MKKKIEAPQEKASSLVEAMKPWRDDPVRFWKEFTGFKPTKWQARAARAVALDPIENPDQKRRFVIHSGHNIGKTAWLANLAWWWTTTRPFSVVVDTAPTFERQVCNIFWGEMRKWGARIGSREDFDLTKSELKWRVPQELRQQLSLNGIDAGNWMVTGASASKKEAIAGYHSPQGVLILIDEASGVEDGIFEALEGALSDTNIRLVLTGNPTRRDGEFYNAFYKRENERLYWRLRQSSHESEVADTKEWCDDMLAKYGEASPVYRSRVLGLPPDDNPSALIPYSSIVDAIARHEETNNYGMGQRAVIGCDVAREGDDASVITTRLGDYVLGPIKEVYGYDSFQVADAVQEEIARVKGIYSSVNVDSIGYGAGVVDILRKRKVIVKDINVSRKASKPLEFLNQRAEFYFRVREWFLSGHAAIPDNDKLKRELLDIHVTFPSGRTQIEPKEQMKRRLQRSPDFADSLMLTFASAGPARWDEVALHLEATYRKERAQFRAGKL